MRLSRSMVTRASSRTCCCSHSRLGNWRYCGLGSSDRQQCLCTDEVAHCAHAWCHSRRLGVELFTAGSWSANGACCKIFIMFWLEGCFLQRLHLTTHRFLAGSVNHMSSLLGNGEYLPHTWRQYNHGYLRSSPQHAARDRERWLMETWWTCHGKDGTTFIATSALLCC